MDDKTLDQKLKRIWLSTLTIQSCLIKLHGLSMFNGKMNINLMHMILELLYIEYNKAKKNKDKVQAKKCAEAIDEFNKFTEKYIDQLDGADKAFKECTDVINEDLKEVGVNWEDDDPDNE